MQSRSAQAVIALVLLTCLVCPVIELFDSWDRTMQTGGDTEYALVLLALCVGVVYCFKHLVVLLSQSLSALSLDSVSPCIEGSPLSGTCSLQLSLAPKSPPLNLRI